MCSSHDVRCSYTSVTKNGSASRSKEVKLRLSVSLGIYLSPEFAFVCHCL